MEMIAAKVTVPPPIVFGSTSHHPDGARAPERGAGGGVLLWSSPRLAGAV